MSVKTEKFKREITFRETCRRKRKLSVSERAHVTFVLLWPRWSCEIKWGAASRNVNHFKRKHKARTPPFRIYISNSHFLLDLEWAQAITAGIYPLLSICQSPALHPLASGARVPPQPQFSGTVHRPIIILRVCLCVVLLRLETLHNFASLFAPWAD